MRELMPLEKFPQEARDRIQRLVEAPTPPPRWLDLGLAQIPSRAWAEWYIQRGIDPDRMRESIPRHLREAVLLRDGYLCQLCGDDVEPTDVHIDHVVPVSLGGANVLGNLQVAHSRCNLRKGNRHPGDVA